MRAFAGSGIRMRIHDITRPLAAGTASWPGDTPFMLQWKETLAGGGIVNLSSISSSPHVGTHVDAPLHVRDGELGVGELPLEAFVGPARVVLVPPDAGSTIGPAVIEGLDLSEPPRILFRTDACLDSGRWNPGFTGISPEAARLLAGRGVLLVGIDTPGIDPPGSTVLPVHHLFLDAGIRWIENLDLSRVSPGVYDLIALPLRIPGGDASPVRAVLIER
jgi:arylformamidase